jgi:SAM-dependent methyltransferase
MKNPSPQSFDTYARDYDQALAKGLQLTGESRDYYARHRVGQIGAFYASRHLRPRRIIDFGCGTGDTLPLLAELPGNPAVIGFEPSDAPRAQARRRFGTAARLLGSDELAAGPGYDACYCNGVFHHIPKAERVEVCRRIAALLTPGGMFFLWENNPANPGTRWVMHRIPFDRDAELLWPAEARRLVRSAGLVPVSLTFHFYFPRSLRKLRRWERWLTSLPLGGQYLLVSSASGDVATATSSPRRLP